MYQCDVKKKYVDINVVKIFNQFIIKILHLSRGKLGT